MQFKTVAVKILLTFTSFVGTYPYDMMFKEDGTIIKTPSGGLKYYLRTALVPTLVAVFHAKIGIYDTLIRDKSLKAMVFVGASTTTVWCVIAIVVVSSLNKKTIVKVFRCYYEYKVFLQSSFK